MITKLIIIVQLIYPLEVLVVMSLMVKWESYSICQDSMNLIPSLVNNKSRCTCKSTCIDYLSRLLLKGDNV